jgi:hypothetical protein
VFERTSRYASLEEGSLVVSDPDGRPRVVTFKRRRFLPPADDLTTVAEHVVTEGERLDRITARYLGDPTQYWRVCDANEVFRPTELTEEPGRRVRIAMVDPGVRRRP